jgi:hypothetical protein
MSHDPQASPTRYQIRVKGALPPERADWFGALTLVVERAADGTAVTVLSGPVADSAALFGVLNRIRDLGLSLISVNPASSGPSN